jgi:hypothetical protein
MRYGDMAGLNKVKAQTEDRGSRMEDRKTGVDQIRVGGLHDENGFSQFDYEMPRF